MGRLIHWLRGELADRLGRFGLAKGLLPSALLAVLLAMLIPAQAQTIPAAAWPHKRQLLREAHGQWGLRAPVAALAAQVEQESGWDPQAISHVGARGMAQFMPATARWWCERTGTSAADCLPHNPTWALRALVGYDKYLFDRTPPRLSGFDRLWLALRAYNGGEGHLRAEAASTGLAAPTRQQMDAACGQARRAVLHCRENLKYPRRILITLQPKYAGWGPVWRMSEGMGDHP